VLRLTVSGGLRRLALASLTALGVACGSSAPSAGVEGGPCYPNSTCNDGLSCLSSLCVAVDAGGSAGAAGATAAAGSSGGGGAGAAGVGGAGTAGAAGAAGNSADGAAGAIGGPGADGGKDAAPGTDSGADAGDVAMDAMAPPDVALIKPAACPAGPFPAPMAGTPQVVCDSGDGLSALRYDSTTGPVWVPTEDAFFFSTYPSVPLSISRYPAAGTALGDIVKYTPGGDCEIVFKDVGTLGLTVAPDGRLIAASYKTSSISELNLVTGQSTVLAATTTGVPMEVPVDVMMTSDGSMYFTTLGGSQGDGLYRIPPAGGSSQRLLSPQAFASGMGMLTMSSDQRRLLAFGIGQINFGTNGQVDSGGIDPITTGQDGSVAYDCANDIVVTTAARAGKLTSYTEAMLGNFPMGRNLAFGGADGMSVLLLNQKSVSVVPMNVPGVL
jgi:sugar lactone lactonase YvrE